MLTWTPLIFPATVYVESINQYYNSSVQSGLQITVNSSFDFKMTKWITHKPLLHLF